MKTNRELLIDFLDSIRDYLHESGCNLNTDERESSEFVDIYLKDKGGESGQLDTYVMPRFNYDKEADVMYISFGDPQKCKTNEMEDGLLHRYNLENKINGITIINYSRRVA